MIPTTIPDNRKGRFLIINLFIILDEEGLF
jgi:hypothetical protein